MHVSWDEMKCPSCRRPMLHLWNGFYQNVLDTGHCHASCGRIHSPPPLNSAASLDGALPVGPSLIRLYFPLCSTH